MSIESQQDHPGADQLDRSRRAMLVGFLVGFVAWQLPSIIGEIWGDVLPRYLELTLMVAALAGLAAFLYYGWRIIQLGRLVRDNPALDEALNDERVRWLRLRAFEAGFWTLVVYMAAVRLVAMAYALPAGAGAFMQLGLVVAASGAILAYLWLDRDTAS